MSQLDNFLNITKIDGRVSAFLNIRDTYNSEIGFELRKIESHYVFGFNNINVLNVVFNNTEV